MQSYDYEFYAPTTRPPVGVNNRTRSYYPQKNSTTILNQQHTRQTYPADRRRIGRERWWMISSASSCKSHHLLTQVSTGVCTDISTQIKIQSPVCRSGHG